GATLRYRLDGDEPQATDPAVSSGSAISIDRSTTLKVRGWRAGWASSDQAVGTYYIDRGTAQTPVLTPAPGTFTGEQSVTITTDTPGALIRYTTDDTEPGLLSPVYSAPVTLSTTTALRARAFAPSMAPSASAGGLYVIDLGTVDPPRLSPGAGSYTTQR